jgi:hypothetical protein
MIHEMDQEMAKVMRIQEEKQKHKGEIVEFMRQLKR